MVLYPPSLPEAVLSRAFRAANGEIGLQPADVNTCLNVCEAAGIEVLGWEVWLVDHRIDPGQADPVPAKGRWCGAIPTRSSKLTVIGGDGNLMEMRRQWDSTDLDAEVDDRWRRFLRVNITFE